MVALDLAGAQMTLDGHNVTADQMAAQFGGIESAIASPVVKVQGSVDTVLDYTNAESNQYGELVTGSDGVDVAGWLKSGGMCIGIDKDQGEIKFVDSSGGCGYLTHKLDYTAPVIANMVGNSPDEGKAQVIASGYPGKITV